MLSKKIMQMALFPLIFSANTFAADNAAVLGAWKMDLNFQGRGVPVVLTITETDNVLGGPGAAHRDLHRCLMSLLTVKLCHSRVKGAKAPPGCHLYLKV